MKKGLLLIILLLITSVNFMYSGFPSFPFGYFNSFGISFKQNIFKKNSVVNIYYEQGFYSFSYLSFNIKSGYYFDNKIEFSIGSDLGMISGQISQLALYLALKPSFLWIYSINNNTSSPGLSLGLGLNILNDYNKASFMFSPCIGIKTYFSYLPIELYFEFAISILFNNIFG